MRLVDDFKILAEGEGALTLENCSMYQENNQFFRLKKKC